MFLSATVLWLSTDAIGDDDFRKTIQPFLKKHCTKCHGENKKPKGEVDLHTLAGEKSLLTQPELMINVIDALDSYSMPPDTEPEIEDEQREKVVRLLKESLKRSATLEETQTRVRRLNRFQYNNSVKDLFGLSKDVFALPEKLMTRHTKYLNGKSRMPGEVNVASYALQPRAGLSDVQAFPKDLRAAHGFDNQANQLTLSPLLLDAFLKLSVSIVESPDFNDKTVGIWNEFFSPPADKGVLKVQVRTRLKKFLRKAFRRKVSKELLDRYTEFAIAKINSGVDYTAVMKKVASATLSSPLFLLRYKSEDATEKSYELAANLSYLLWASCPDDALLDLAEQGKLTDQKILAKTIERMFGDPKIERFLDTFPSQWMQLENVLAATPDPRKQRLYSLDKDFPAGLHMLLEPLLLFDTVFVENRPVIELIQPEFVFQSDFLETWYTIDLKPPKVDTKKILAQNQVHDQQRKELREKIAKAKQELTQLIDPVRQRLLASKKNEKEIEPVDLKPIASWEFDDNLKASMGGLDLTAHGKVTFENGRAVLNQSYLISKPIPVDLKEKTLEVWCVPHNLDQRGGGVMGIQGQGDFFDTIVLGERQNRHWISGSNGFSRTLDFAESYPEPKPNELIHLVMVYRGNGETLLYRNGQPYGKPFNKGRAVFPKGRSQVLFGLRHLPAGGNRYLHVSIDKARLYDRALTPVEVLAANSGRHQFVTDEQLEAALTPEQKQQRDKIQKTQAGLEAELKKVPGNQDPKQVVNDARFRFDNEIRRKMRSQTFRRTLNQDARYGGIITNAAIMSMTSGPKRTHPIARGAWIIEVVFNDPPPPPPNDVPPLNEDASDRNLTIREKFKVHRENPDCAGCHSRLDPLGFAMENFDITGRWRNRYENGRNVDMQGTLIQRYPFKDVVEFKQAIVQEEERFAKAFTAHLLRFALSRELSPRDKLQVESIVAANRENRYRLKDLVKTVVLSQAD